jgi:hypothetical protein
VTADDYVTIETKYGPVVMPAAQADAAAACIDVLLAQGLQPIWHMNHCGCCLSVHAIDDEDKGFIVGSDGGADWIEHADY